MEHELKEFTAQAIDELYNKKIDIQIIQIQRTKKEFKGDFTLVVFPLLKYSSKKPEETANDLGNFLKLKSQNIKDFNVVKGFLNIVLKDEYWINFLNQTHNINNYGIVEKNENPKTIVIEFSSPNTNKPLHLGHLRNNFLGDSLSRILKANGHNIVRVNLVNDRGIHICKSMLAWQKWGNQQTPESTNKKGDHLVGDYYVLFDKEYKKQVDTLVNQNNITLDQAKKDAELLQEAQTMLQKWEDDNAEVKQLWKRMNTWVLNGFEVTYKKLGIEFEKTYFESDTYSIGKQLVLDALKKGIAKIKSDNTIYVDFENENLDEKVLLRADGTSVYITQDLGTAAIRFDEYKFDNHIYVVGNEQEYHFQVLKKVIQKFGYDWANRLEHFSYGMVELPEGKMKSREGKVVDADDLVEEMINTATEKTNELGKLNNATELEKNETIRKIALGALKYFILKVDPKKNMVFNPAESIDFNGNTGPFIQYAYTRIKSILRNAIEKNIQINKNYTIDFELNEKEIALLQNIYQFPEIINESGKKYSPALIANYVYELVKDFNQFYHDFSILNEENINYRSFRLILIETISRIIENSLKLLGIEVPQKM